MPNLHDLGNSLVYTAQMSSISDEPAWQSDPAIDMEFDPERRVGSKAPFLDWYIRHSEAARRELRCELDVPFGDNQAETLDIFPAATRRSPVLVFIHGGYWRALSSREFSFVARGFADAGVTVVVTNYALCPHVSIAEITRQSRAALIWIHRFIDSYGGDPANMFVAGHSAGGQQVAMMLGTDWLQRPEATSLALRGGIAISGLFDLRPLMRSWLQPTLRLTDALVQSQSPLLNIPLEAPPLMLSVGGNESASFLQQTQGFRQSWSAAGLAAEYFPQPGLNHFEAIYGLANSEDPLARAILDFMRRHGP